MKKKFFKFLLFSNVIISQISNAFIFSFIECLFLELVEEFLIKILPDFFFNDDKYYNRSYVLRIRDLSVYDFSQTNITICTSAIGAFIFYKINEMWNKNKNEENKENKENKENDVNFSDVLVLFLFYFISIISLIFL